MKVLFGLGNPGRDYEKTRHNIGFRVVQNFAKEAHVPLKRSISLEAVWGKQRYQQQEIRICLPQSYMNQSGRVVAHCLKKWRLSPENILVVVDDLHLTLGQLRIRAGGSDGGQKGLHSVIEALGTERFPRLRVGIGISAEKQETNGWTDFVLRSFSRREAPVVEEVVTQATACCRLWIEEGMERCMNRFNVRSS